MCGIIDSQSKKGMISMTFDELRSEKERLLRAIEKEKGITWHKIFKIIELNALLSKNNTL